MGHKKEWIEAYTSDNRGHNKGYYPGRFDSPWKGSFQGFIVVTNNFYRQ